MSDHAIATQEEKTENGYNLVRWTCICGAPQSRWLQTKYLALSLGQHVRGRENSHA